MEGFFYEGVILENPNLKSDWERGLAFPEGATQQIPGLPSGVMPGVSSDIYNAYRQGRDSACVDIVIATVLEEGTPPVLMSFRKPSVCFGLKWWIYGGALQSYTRIGDFISGRATKECGVTVEPQALIGVYRTMAHDHIGSTLQPCYVAKVPIDAIRAKMETDGGHSDVRLFTLPELPEESNTEHHWYPLRVARMALSNMPR